MRLRFWIVLMRRVVWTRGRGRQARWPAGRAAVEGLAEASFIVEMLLDVRKSNGFRNTSGVRI